MFRRGNCHVNIIKTFAHEARVFCLRRENMLNHSKTYSMIVVGAVGGAIVIEALTNPLKKEEYYCLLNREADIPTENFSYSPLPYSGMVVAGTTSGSGYIVIS